GDYQANRHRRPAGEPLRRRAARAKTATRMSLSGVHALLVIGPGRLDNQCEMFHFWSLHSGGANFVFADCRVQFIAYSGVKALPPLATRAGRDNFGLDDY